MSARLTISNVVSIPDDVMTAGTRAAVRSMLTFDDADGTRIRAYNELDDRWIIPRGWFHTTQLKYRVPVETDDFRTSSTVPWPELQMELRSDQQLPVNKLARKGYGVLEAATGAGKTICGLVLAGRLQQRTLVLVHTKELLHQWVDRAHEVYGDDFEVGVLGDGQHTERTLTIATVQSLSRMGDLPYDWLAQWGCVILDECHRAPAWTFADVLQQMTARYLFGLSATPERTDGREPLLYAIIGPVVARITEGSLVAAGKLHKPVVEWIQTDFWCPEAQQMNFAHNQWARNALYQKLIANLVDDDERIDLVAQVLAEQGGRYVLVLSERIDHLKRMMQALNDRMYDANAALLTGKMRPAERAEILDRMRAGDLHYLFATQLADEGLDIPLLDTLALTFPRRSKQKVQQQVGRIMRVAEGKTGARVLDFVDVRVPTLLNQARVRHDYYVRSKGCDVQGWVQPTMQQLTPDTDIGKLVTAKPPTLL